MGQKPKNRSGQIERGKNKMYPYYIINYPNYTAVYLDAIAAHAAAKAAGLEIITVKN